MSQHSHNEQLNEVKLLLTILTANAEHFARRGITADFIAKLNHIYYEIRSIDREQQQLQSQIKTKTAELHQRLVELDELFGEAQKVVQLETVHDLWKSFGKPEQKYVV